MIPPLTSRTLRNDTPRCASAMGRRGFLSAITLSCVALGAGRAVASIDHERPSRDNSVLDIIAPRIEPHLKMFNVHTKEKIDVTYYDSVSGYDRKALDEIFWIMRDWRQEEAPQQDERLLWGLSAISQASQLEGSSGLIRLHSGFRTARTNRSLRNAATHSLHLQARAADFVIPGVPVNKISEYAKWLEIGGVGHYPGSFTHIDTGDLRAW